MATHGTWCAAHGAERLTHGAPYMVHSMKRSKIFGEYDGTCRNVNMG